jgi:hypothetical protein
VLARAAQHVRRQATPEQCTQASGHYLGSFRATRNVRAALQ